MVPEFPLEYLGVISTKQTDIEVESSAEWPGQEMKTPVVDAFL